MQDIDTVHEESEGQWISIADVMSVTMMIFMFFTVIFMATVQADKESIEEIAITYNRLQSDLYEDLKREFKDDLPKWAAEISRETLSITFREPEVLFEQGKAAMKEKFRNILIDFFPRYVKILTSEKYKADIEEVRVEGHTSSEWATLADAKVAYFNNMALSQQRTRAVLEYVLNLIAVAPNFAWLKGRLTANGLSSSKPVLEDGRENREKSRRVEFRVRTNAEKRIVQIIKGKQKP